jgi:hypothetical protein
MRQTVAGFYSRTAMIAVLLLGWLLFTSTLETRSVWYDEPSNYAVLDIGFPDYLQWVAGDVHAPLYFTYILIWQAIVDTQHLTIMRISSVLSAMLAIAMCYRLAVDWFRNQWAGVAAAVFLATSGLYVHYATDFRVYTLLVFFVALNWWALWRLLTVRRGGFWLYALTLALLAYTHYFAVFAIFPQIFIILGGYLHRLKQFLAAAILALILFSPWLPTAINQITIAQEQGGQTEVVGKTLGTEPTSVESISNLVERYSAGKPEYIILLLVLSLGVLPSLNKPQRIWYLAAWFWYFVPLLAMFSINPIIRVYALRYTLPVFPGVALLMGAAVASFSRQSMRFAVFALLVIINLVTLTDGYVIIPTEPPHRTLIQYVDNRFQPGDRVWYNMEAGALGSSARDVEIHMRHETKNVTLDDFVWDAPYDFEDTTLVPRVWIVRPYWLEIPEVAAPALKNGRIVTDTFAVGAYIVDLYEAPPPTPAAIFDNLLALRASPLNEIGIRRGSEIQVNTWWDVTETPARDYSYSLLLTPQTNPDNVTMQYDGGLQSRLDVLDTENLLSTSSWTTNTTYFAPIFVTLPEQLPAGDYSIWLGVYYWEDGELLELTETGALAEYATRPLIELLSFEVD